MAEVGRAVGLDVHLDFCEVAICEAGKVRSAGRVASTPEALGVLAASLTSADTVALEVTGSAWEIVRILESHVAKVVVVSPGDTGIAQARAKTDRLDARTLARLLWSGELDAVWTPDELTRVLRRRLARREQLVRARTRVKNEIHAVLMRRLVGRPPFSDLFGVKGRRWLRRLELPVEECETVEGCMRHVEFLDAEIAEVERLIARYALSCSDARRLMSVPGVNVICAATFLAAIGDIRRFRTSRRLVGYLGLDPRVRQSGSSPARGGRISKQPKPHHLKIRCGVSPVPSVRIPPASNSPQCSLERDCDTPSAMRAACVARPRAGVIGASPRGSCIVIGGRAADVLVSAVEALDDIPSAR